MKMLVANRGEIAVRVMRTCRELGIPTVAVYSDVDAGAPHVVAADESVCLGAPEPTASYLNTDKILAAAAETGADAIHPGYGFLAENAEFAERCLEAGVTFVGPPAPVIRILGDKTEARRLMQAAGVPVLPGMDEACTDLAQLKREAKRIGYPLLVKAAAGGGGKGMHRIDSEQQLEQACAAAMREGENAFDDASVFLEKYHEAPRHIEVQILADTHGNVIHLGERECSIQRRHQKLVEETPSPFLNEALRARMTDAAVAAARASKYVNAGTVEFLVADEGEEFYFLEVNTRLQVEHPVTEMTTGLDLVRLQIEIASGEPLALAQEDVARNGHAIECRVYAEDPGADFRPSPGRIALHQQPVGEGVRTDCGVTGGSIVPMEYDPILSKVITFGGTRDEARERMATALESYAVLGISTTIPFLIDAIRSTPFAAGETRTDFIPRNFSDWSQGGEGAELAAIAFLLDDLCVREDVVAGEAAAVKNPWETLGSWRL